MLQALSDFRYKALRLTLDRDAPGDTRIGLHIAGANPALHGGYPVELNVTLTGELDRMLREGIEGYRVPERILERMQRFGQSD